MEEKTVPITDLNIVELKALAFDIINDMEVKKMQLQQVQAVLKQKIEAAQAQPQQ